MEIAGTARTLKKVNQIFFDFIKHLFKQSDTMILSALMCKRDTYLLLYIAAQG